MRLSPRLRSRLQVWSLRATRQIALRLGNEFPFYYVSEYPKSGGTWVAQMLADYLQVPFPQHYCLPIAHEAVLHNHWRYDPRLAPRTVHVMRDGRDACVSAFYHLRRVGRDPGEFGPDFIDWWATHPMGGAGVTWGQYCREWAEGCYSHKETRYETLSSIYLLDEIALAIENVTGGRRACTSNLKATIGKYDFAKQTRGRLRGTEDASSPLRKGIVGDWRNHFDDECVRRFKRHFGEDLIVLGYENDIDWPHPGPIGGSE